MIRPVDLGICHGYEYDGDPARTAVLLPGTMLGGMPSLAFAQLGLTAAGWRIVQVWDEFLDRSQDANEWVHERLAAAVRRRPAATRRRRSRGLVAPENRAGAPDRRDRRV